MGSMSEYLGIYHQLRLIQFFSVLYHSTLVGEYDFKGFGATSEEKLKITFSSTIDPEKRYYTMTMLVPAETGHFVQVIPTKLEVTRSDGVEATSMILAYGDVWVCCSCGGDNTEANAPERCPLCGHYRQGCC